MFVHSLTMQTLHYFYHHHYYYYIRSWTGLHRLPEGRQPDAGGSSLGRALLLHAAASGTRQPGDQYVSLRAAFQSPPWKVRWFLY